MSNSVNKAIIVGNLGNDPDISVKPCAACGSPIDRPPKASAQQWANRKFCSRRCAAKKRTVNDADIVSQYINGHSSTEIGETVGLSGTHILRILKQNGVEIRGASEGKKLAAARPEFRRKLRNANLGRKQKEPAKQKLRELTGSKRANWRAGLTLNVYGYLHFTSSPENGCHASRAVHRVIAEWKTGRALKKGEHVHHIDGNKLNNDPANLQVMTASEHARLHALERGFGRARKNAC